MSSIDVAALPVLPIRKNLGGSVLSVDGATGASRLRYLPGKHLENSAGTIFGGYLAAIVDDAAGITAWFGGGKRRFATASMSVSFIRPVLDGDALVADTTVSELNERHAVVDVKLTRESDGKTMVTGRVVQAFLKPKGSPSTTRPEENP